MIQKTPASVRLMDFEGEYVSPDERHVDAEFYIRHNEIHTTKRGLPIEWYETTIVVAEEMMFDINEPCGATCVQFKVGHWEFRIPLNYPAKYYSPGTYVLNNLKLTVPEPVEI